MHSKRRTANTSYHEFTQNSQQEKGISIDNVKKFEQIMNKTQPVFRSRQQQTNLAKTQYPPEIKLFNKLSSRISE